MNVEAYSRNPIVHKYIRWYLTHTDALYTLTQNAAPYISYIVRELEKRGMPLELALLPMVESSYNPVQKSKKGAVGLWQMMPTTALDLGISINKWYDGRRDVVASTHAALDYLQYLHHYFKTWPLTFAAYNSGIGTVQKAMLRNQRLGLPTLYRRLKLPLQTKAYVPKLVALATLLSEPEHYHLPIHPVNTEQVFTSVTLKNPLSLKKIATLAGCELAWIKKLNPGFRKGRLTPLATDYEVLIPANKLDPFETNLTLYLSTLPKHKLYLVKKGDSLSTIAYKHHITLASLKAHNQLNTNLIKIHQALYIPNAV